MSGGPDNAGFGGEDLAYQAAQRANLASFQTVDPNSLGRYEVAAAQQWAPKVYEFQREPIVVSPAHEPVATVSSDHVAVLEAECRLQRIIITAIVQRIATLNGGGDVEPEVAACLADVRELARQAVEMERKT